MPVYAMCMVAVPAEIGFSTARVTISLSLSGVTFAFCVLPLLVMVTSWKSISTALSAISEVGFSARMEIVSSPSNVAFSRSSVNVSL